MTKSERIIEKAQAQHNCSAEAQMPRGVGRVPLFNRIKTILESKLRKVRRSVGGFSLIELLVVVLIIGILAAIAIPIFLSQQNQARDAAAKSDLGNAKIALISYSISNGGSYGTAGEDELADFGYVESDGVKDFSITFDLDAPSAFCIQATSAAENTFHVKHDSGVLEDDCP
jgi:type IV pilus assembly protein PilA